MLNVCYLTKQNILNRIITVPYVLQITTNSNLLTPGEVRDIAKCTNIDPGLVSILSLQSFDTEQQFCRQLRYV